MSARARGCTEGVGGEGRGESGGGEGGARLARDPLRLARVEEEARELGRAGRAEQPNELVGVRHRGGRARRGRAAARARARARWRAVGLEEEVAACLVAGEGDDARQQLVEHSLHVGEARGGAHLAAGKGNGGAVE